MLFRRHVALTIAVMLLASPVFAVDKEAPKKSTKKEKRDAPRARTFALPLAFGYSVDLRMSLLRNKKVQEDLKLDEKQTTAIKKTLEEINAKVDAILATVRGVTPKERSKIFVEASEELQTYIAEQSKKLLAMLKVEQSNRLDQIVVQSLGIGALDDPKIAKELKITAEQKQKMAKVRESIYQKYRKVLEDIRAGKVDPAKYDEKLQEIDNTSDRDQRILGVLSKEQQIQFEKMEGEKLELGRNNSPYPVPGPPSQIVAERIEVKPMPKKP